MMVQDLCNLLPLKSWVPEANLAVPVIGGYTGDLLSRAIGKAGVGSVWLTIMSNQNVAAVALVAKVACVILTEDVEPDKDLVKQAIAHRLPLFSSPLSSYELAGFLSKVLAD